MYFRGFLDTTEMGIFMSVPPRTSPVYILSFVANIMFLVGTIFLPLFLIFPVILLFILGFHLGVNWLVAVGLASEFMFIGMSPLLFYHVVIPTLVFRCFLQFFFVLDLSSL